MEQVIKNALIPPTAAIDPTGHDVIYVKSHEVLQSLPNDVYPIRTMMHEMKKVIIPGRQFIVGQHKLQPTVMEGPYVEMPEWLYYFPSDNQGVATTLVTVANHQYGIPIWYTPCPKVYALDNIPLEGVNITVIGTNLSGVSYSGDQKATVITEEEYQHLMNNPPSKSGLV